MYSSPPTQLPRAASRPPASQSHRRSGSLTESQLPQNTSLPSIRQLHPNLPPPGIPPSMHPAEPLAPYTYPAPPHFVPHPSSSSTTTISSSPAGTAPHQPPPPPPPYHHHSPLGREHDPDAYPMAESEIEDTEQPPKKKRRRQALSCTECKRRKIKCDRTQPCGPCTRRGEQAKCHWHVVEPVEKYVTRAEYDELKSRFEHLEAFVHRIAPPGLVPPPPPSSHSASSSLPPPGTVSLYHVGMHPPGDGSAAPGIAGPSGYPPTAVPTHMIFPGHAPPPPQHPPQQQHGGSPSHSHLTPVQHHAVPPPTQQHAPPHFDQGHASHAQATSVPVQAQRYDLHPPQHQQHQSHYHHQTHYGSVSPSLPHMQPSPRSSGGGGGGPSSSSPLLGMGPPSPPKEARSPLISSATTMTSASATTGAGSSSSTKKSPLSLAAITSPPLTSPRQKNFHAQMLKLGECLRLVQVPLSGAREGPVVAVVEVEEGAVEGHRVRAHRSFSMWGICRPRDIHRLQRLQLGVEALDRHWGWDLGCRGGRAIRRLFQSQGLKGDKLEPRLGKGSGIWGNATVRVL